MSCKILSVPFRCPICGQESIDPLVKVSKRYHKGHEWGCAKCKTREDADRIINRKNTRFTGWGIMRLAFNKVGVL